MFQSTRFHLVDWDTPSFTSWKYSNHCPHKHDIICIPINVGYKEECDLNESKSFIQTRRMETSRLPEVKCLATVPALLIRLQNHSFSSGAISHASLITSFTASPALNVARCGPRIFEREGGGGGVAEESFRKKRSKQTIAHIYYHDYIRTLDICSHHKLTQQHHYSHSGCLIVYKKRRCSLHDFNSSCRGWLATLSTPPPPRSAPGGSLHIGETGRSLSKLW